VLRRGYAIVSRDGAIVNGKAELNTEDLIDLEFHDGTVRSKVLGG
jgi:exonuclease VII large subunit